VDDDAPVLLAIDGNSLVHRSFHSQAATGLRAPDGRPLWAIRGLLTQLVAAAERICPAAIVIGFDDPDRSIRRDRWPQYKAGRTEKLDTLVSQLRTAAEVSRELGLAVVVPDGLEADDVLASVARHAPTIGARTVIMTSDRDAFPLIDEHTRVLRIINGGVEASPVLTAERFVTMLGIRPAQYRDLAALRGDPSDNLPGIRGIGPKIAAKLLAACGSADAVFEDLAGSGELVRAAVGPALAARLAEPGARAAWELNCQVMALHDDLELGLDLRRGPGVLPLAADSVRAVCAAHRLTWTAPTALRALAYQDGPPPRPVPVPAPVWSTMSDSYSGRRFPPLRKRELTGRAALAANQLSLFD
jgi:5'-3' exonuclease